MRQEPDRGERHPHAVGLRREPDLLRDACDEAQRVVDEGVATPEQVDQLMVDCFSWPVGPFAMIRGATGGWT